MMDFDFDAFFQTAPLEVNVDAIRQQWQSLGAPYDVERWILPLPVWQHREFDHSETRSWEILQQDLTTGDPRKPFCIYLHIPFCFNKCDFCDSYSFKLGSQQVERLHQYVERLCYEMKLWSRNGNLSQRPVSTIHLGGGTPPIIGEEGLTQIVTCCKENFNTSAETEWAIESTVGGLSPEMVAATHELGFRRLHLGVQSLHDDVRKLIGRRQQAGEVLNVIQATRSLGWIVSVDMLCGLPGQSIENLLADLQTLIAAGVNGFSLYELLIFNQNRKWAEVHGLIERSHLPNYLTFLAGTFLLEEAGFQKTLFNHWADYEDKNIYFTFPTRNEDCLAIGTLADGVFGDFHYRHYGYAPYLRAARNDYPGLEGGLRRTEFESLMHPINTILLTGLIPQQVHEPLANSSGEILERWQKMDLVEFVDNGNIRLTGSGSWFIGNMIEELSTFYRKVYFT
jgi:coproporphyrinogen III oxidase-like Fe-S oxidoreductase